MIPWPSIIAPLAMAAAVLGVIVLVLILLQLATDDAENTFFGLAILVLFMITVVLIAMMITIVIGTATGALNLVEVLAP